MAPASHEVQTALEKNPQPAQRAYAAYGHDVIRNGPRMQIPPDSILLASMIMGN
jgi:hypothetical protein